MSDTIEDDKLELSFLGVDVNALSLSLHFAFFGSTRIFLVMAAAKIERN